MALGPPAATEDSLSDQLRPSLKPSLDVDLWVGVKQEKGTEEEKGENNAKAATPLCCNSEVPIIPFMLRQEMPDVVRKRLINIVAITSTTLTWAQLETTA